MKKIFSSIPQLSVLVIILALLKTFIYYNNFDVPIKYYIGISELALLISGDLLILVPVVLLMYFFNVDTGVKKEKKEINNIPDKEPDKKVITVERSKFSKVVQQIVVHVIAGLITLAVLIGPILLIANLPSYSDKVIGVTCLLLIGFFIIFFNQQKKLEHILTAEGMSSSLFAIIFLFMFISGTTAEISSVEKGQYKGTKIYTSDSTYISTDSAYFIGQTSNYVFFYSKNGKYTTILPTSEIKKIELYSK